MIKSMTAFARGGDQGDWGQIVWEVCSVNHRYLDVSLRLPESLRELDTAVRERIKHHVSRGKVDCQLQFQPGVAAQTDLSLNEGLVSRLGDVCKQASALLPGAAPIDLIKILQWPGVLTPEDIDMKPIEVNALASLDKTLASLVVVREREGKKLQAVLFDRVEKLQAHVSTVKTRVPLLLDEQRQKITARFNELSLELDAQRLEQELVFMTQKIDVSEELDRLEAHFSEIDRILKHDDLVGRRLDFFMQELNRETNTLGSKSSDITLTQAMLDMKVLIEQMREQVQNLE